MTDPRRLMAGGDEPADLGSSELTRWLITSARSEEPGTHALQRALVGVGATGAVLAATASASAVSSGAGVATGSAASAAASSAVGTTGTVAAGAGASAVGAAGAVTGKAAAGLLGAVGKGAALKWVAVSVIGGATLVGAGSQLLAPTQSTVPTSQPVVSQSESSGPAIAAPIAVPTPSPEPELAPLAVTPPATAHTAGRATTAPESDDPEVMEATALAKEVQLIDQAREAKAAGQHAQVVTLTQRYLSSFPRGRLLPEAVFLKMESESALGRSQQAAQSAKLLLRVAPNSPQATRARELSAPSTP